MNGETPSSGPTGVDPSSPTRTGATVRVSPPLGNKTPTGLAKNDAMSRLLSENWWAIALRGVCGVLFGIITFVSPVATLLTLALFFAAYLLVDGVFGIISAVRAARAHDRWGLLLAEGALNILMGLIAALFPASAVSPS